MGGRLAMQMVPASSTKIIRGAGISTSSSILQVSKASSRASKPGIRGIRRRASEVEEQQQLSAASSIKQQDK